MNVINAPPGSISDKMPFRFLDLPMELRFMCYDIAVRDAGVVFQLAVVQGDGGEGRTKLARLDPEGNIDPKCTAIRKVPAALSMACKHVHQEYEQIEHEVRQRHPEQLHVNLLLLTESLIRHDISMQFLSKSYLNMEKVKNVTIAYRMDFFDFTVGESGLAGLLVALATARSLRLNVLCPRGPWLDHYFPPLVRIVPYMQSIVDSMPKSTAPGLEEFSIWMEGGVRDHFLAHRTTRKTATDRYFLSRTLSSGDQTKTPIETHPNRWNIVDACDKKKFKTWREKTGKRICDERFVWA